MLRIILLITAFWLVAGCSSKVEYHPSNIVLAPQNAVNINTATAEELEKLPHIGRKTAETIIQFRTENGPFRRPEYLLQIRGVSERRFLETRQFIRTE